METFKIKISPEVLKGDLGSYNYSGQTIGFYSGMSDVLSAGTINLGTWSTQPVMGVAGTLGAGALQFLGPNSNLIYINTVGSNGYNWQKYLMSILPGAIIQITAEGTTYTFIKNNQPPNIYQPGFELIDIVLTDFVGLYVIPSGVTENIPYDIDVNLTIIQPNTSQLIDLSIPVLLKQDYEDIGYYSPFDGYVSQLSEEVNFTFSATTLLPYRYCIYNTSNYNLNYFQNAVYTVDWGDDSTIQQVEVVIPQSFCHIYPNIGTPRTYTITFSGVNSVGAYSVTKNVEVPYTDIVPSNPYGSVNFISNGGSWSATPSSQNYIYNYDSINTVAGQVSSNYVSTPFIVSGFTQSRLNELKVYGPQPYILNLNRILSDGTEGYIVSQTPEYTEYIINEQTYIDFANGTTIFVVQSEGFTENTITATTITKFEYLMNVIEQPEIQSNVFIERGKYSGLENFRRIGDINNTGALRTYGYGFFDVKFYDNL